MASGILSDTYALIDAGELAGIRLRLLGGLGIVSSCPLALSAPFARDYSDADVVTCNAPSAVEAFMREQAWQPKRDFNMYNGDRRLIFISPSGIKLDVFIKTFSMSHSFNFEKRLPPSGRALYPADLLLTKLQVHDINEKDLSDACCLFASHELSENDSGIHAAYIEKLCVNDWGLYNELNVNMEKTAAWASMHLGEGSETVRDAALRRIHELGRRMAAAPQSVVWRMRAALGTKARWYAEVEEVDS